MFLRLNLLMADPFSAFDAFAGSSASVLAASALSASFLSVSPVGVKLLFRVGATKPASSFGGSSSCAAAP